ncbi:hypothetical protein [Sphingopyxis sp. P8]|uniref:hypothetical protein n=1 Tax=Sphingopyxis sp. P8 TaxID=2763256 RepID=UPI001D0A64ED|nr:hypothetical protein [Sphingopyxis sp. P8]
MDDFFAALGAEQFRLRGYRTNRTSIAASFRPTPESRAEMMRQDGCTTRLIWKVPKLKYALFRLAMMGVFVGAPTATAAAATPDERAEPPFLQRWTKGQADPGAGLPGWYSETPGLHVHRPLNGTTIPLAEADILRRRAMVAFEALMQQPSLRDVRGTSLQADINISVVPTADGVRLVGATLSILAKSVVEGDKATISRNGRFMTPTEEGAVLRVFLNPYQMLATRDVQAEGMDGRLLRVRTGSAYGLFVSDASTAFEPRAQEPWQVGKLAAELQRDRSWYQLNAIGSHPLLVHVSSYAQENDDLRRGRLDPERPVARLAAAMFMVDWDAVHRRMTALK